MPGSSDRRSRLQTARDALALAIDTCESNRDLSGLVREYRATLAELDGLPDAAEESNADEIAARRAARRSGAAPSPRSKRSS